MSEKDNNALANWLLVVCGLIMFMVVFGGAVRLTRSGLSIVEWNPISGVVPPISEAAWQAEFAKYQESPEFQKINSTMTLTGYKEIFYLEWFHRLIARFAGLFVAIPLLRFLWKGIIPRKKSALYIAIGLLFGFQGYLGWYMVSSGLENNPHVSHFRLTIHLLTAILLLGLAAWALFNHKNHFPRFNREALGSSQFRLAATMMAVLILQIAYGGLMAGLKAGYLTNQWPLMFGRLIPPGMAAMKPWWDNFFSSTTTVHFIHRWFAFAVLLAAFILYWRSRSQSYAAQVAKGVLWMVGLTALQIFLGVTVVWFKVNIVLALTHQLVALFLFVTTLYINYHVLHQTEAVSG